ncbi:unnamed protein product [Ectocarpus sp. 12 AP-2014]
MMAAATLPVSATATATRQTTSKNADGRRLTLLGTGTQWASTKQAGPKTWKNEEILWRT